MSPAMSRSEREVFLSEVHVGVLSVSESGGGPLCVPVWYSYSSGGPLSVITGIHSRKARLIDEAGRFSLCAQSEVAPYRYVSVEGPVTSRERPVDPNERRAMAHRYLGQEFGDLYFEATETEAEDSTVYRMSPKRWMSADFSGAFT